MIPPTGPAPFAGASVPLFPCSSETRVESRSLLLLLSRRLAAGAENLVGQPRPLLDVLEIGRPLGDVEDLLRLVAVLHVGAGGLVAELLVHALALLRQEE